MANTVIDLSSKCILLLIIIVLIYYFVNRCSCKDSFRVGGQESSNLPWSKDYIHHEFGNTSNSRRIFFLDGPGHLLGEDNPSIDSHLRRPGSIKDEEFLYSYGIKKIQLYKSHSPIYDYAVKIFIDSPNLNDKWYEFNVYMLINFYIKAYKTKEDYDNKTNPCDDDSYNLSLYTFFNHRTSQYDGLVDFNLDCDKESYLYIELWKIEFRKVVA